MIEGPILRALIATAVVGSAALFVAGYVTGCSRARSASDAAAAVAASAAAASSAEMKAEARHLRRERDSVVIRIAGEYERQLGELRGRAGRLPDTARPACRGATGAELSGEDGSVLAGEAARADGLRAALRECYGWVRAVKGMPPLPVDGNASAPDPQ